MMRVRWQIELLFKLWKNEGHIDSWRSEKPWRIPCELYAKLIAMVIQHWILERKEVKEHIKKVDTKIKNIDDIEIYFGIKTGLVEAFIIDQATRKRLIREVPKSKEIIKPILRGRDIKRWKIEFAGMYLLATGYVLMNILQYTHIYKILKKEREKDKTRGKIGGI